jgi:hypothetical protein
MACGGLAALVAFLFFPALFCGRVLWYRDIYGYWLAQAESFVRVVAGGALPLWNPYVSFGLPMLADPSYQALYPVTWLNLVLRPGAFYTFYAVFHACLSGLGMLLLGRRLALGTAPALLAACVWISSGPFLGVTSQTHHFGSTAYVPWVLLALERAMATRGTRSAIALAAVATLQAFAGSADVCLMTAFAALLHVALQPGARIGARGLARLLLLALPLAAALAALQWLPTVGILAAGLRLALAPETRLFWSLHPASLVDLLVPRLVSGLPWNEGLRALLFGAREPLFASVYLGAAAAVLAASALVGPWSRMRVYASLGVALSLMAALGRFAPLYPALAALPPLGLLRYPAKYTIAAAFFWALLVGLAGRDWLHEASQRRRAAAGLAGALLGCACLAASVYLYLRPSDVEEWLERGAPAIAAAGVTLVAAGTCAWAAGLLAWCAPSAGRARSVALAMLMALVVGDTAMAGRASIPFAPAELVRARPRALALIAPGSRVYFDSGEQGDLLKAVARVPEGWRRPWALALGNIELLRPPSAARWGLRGGYDGDFTGLAPPLLSNLTLIVENAAGTPLGQRLLRLGGVDYLVALGPARWPGLEAAGEVASVFQAPITLWRVSDTRPRVFVAAAARVAVEPESVRILAAPDFDPAREVILAAGARRQAPEGFTAQVEALEEHADRASYAVAAAHGGWLVVLETYHSGWQATLDGEPAPVLRADVLFRAVQVPPGRHVVAFRYRPAPVYAGLAASGAGVLAALVLGAIASSPKEPAA